MYAGYGSLVARGGAVGVMFDHPFHDGPDLVRSAERLTGVVDTVRQDPRIDPDRIALWFFSGGGLLSADSLRDPPPWLRCLAATYPVLGVPDEWGIDARFRPIEAVASGAFTGPMVLTRVGLERPWVAAYVAGFLTAAHAAGLRPDIIDVPGGQHGFDHLDDTDESRQAISDAVSAVLASIMD